MRSKPEDDYEHAELARLNAEPWQVALLDLNPSYVHWGPHEDYMPGKSWQEPLFYDSWRASGPFSLDDLNEVVHFYFSVERDSERCAACDGSGHNPATKQISDDFYDCAGMGRRWCDAITEDEATALIEAGRIGRKWNGLNWDERVVPAPTAAQINAINARGSVVLFGEGAHDAINSTILVKTRAKRLGVYGKCTACDGHGEIFTAPAAHSTLTLWVLHPRKGAARGVEVKIVRDDLSEVYAFLREAAERNAERFAKVVAL